MPDPNHFGCEQLILSEAYEPTTGVASLHFVNDPPCTSFSMILFEGPKSDRIDVFKDVVTGAEEIRRYKIDSDVKYDSVVHATRLPDKCGRCGNWPEICGHGMTFTQKMKSVGINRLWART